MEQIQLGKQDMVFAGGGDDQVIGANLLTAGVDPAQDNDKLFGERGNDAVAGGPGNDLVAGGADDDRAPTSGLGQDLEDRRRARPDLARHPEAPVPVADEVAEDAVLL